MNAQDAAQAFSTPLRLRLIRHYLDHPGPQVAAAEALGISTAVVSHNTKALQVLGVVTRHRGPVYRVDEQRRDELIAALRAYIVSDPDSASSSQ